MHLIAFILNVVLWLVMGFIVAKKADKIFGRKHTRNTMIGLSAAFVGGMFGFLINGFPNSTFSPNNFLYSFVFTIIGLSLNIPKLRRVYREIFSFNLPNLRISALTFRKRAIK